MQSDEGRLARAHRAETGLDYPARADYPPRLAIENSTGAELNWVYTSRADESLFGHFDFTTAWGPARDEPRAAQSLMRASTMTGEAFTGSHVAVFTRPAPPTLVVSPHSPRADTAGEQKRRWSVAGGGRRLSWPVSDGWFSQPATRGEDQHAGAAIRHARHGRQPETEKTSTEAQARLFPATWANCTRPSTRDRRRRREDDCYQHGPRPSRCGKRYG